MYQESFPSKKSLLPGPKAFVKGKTYDASTRQDKEDGTRGRIYIPVNERIDNRREFMEELTKVVKVVEQEERPKAIEELKKREILLLERQERLTKKQNPRIGSSKVE